MKENIDLGLSVSKIDQNSNTNMHQWSDKRWKKPIDRYQEASIGADFIVLKDKSETRISISPDTKERWKSSLISNPTHL